MNIISIIQVGVHLQPSKVRYVNIISVIQVGVDLWSSVCIFVISYCGCSFTALRMHIVIV